MKKIKIIIIIFSIICWVQSVEGETSNQTKPLSFSTSSFDFFGQNNDGFLILHFNIHNNSEKSIDYLTLRIEAINKSGDVLQPEMGSSYYTITKSISPHENYKMNINSDASYAKKVDKVKLRATFVKYTDGSEKEFPSDSFLHKKSLKRLHPAIIITTLLAITLSVVLIQFI